MTLLVEIFSDEGKKVTLKREKFVQLAEKRVIRTMHDLRLIGNLANKNNYEYTDKDVDQIINALQSEITSLKAQFKSSTGRNTINFSLK